MFYICSFLLAGFVLQLAARTWPIRTFDGKKEILIDVVALLVAGACLMAIPHVSAPWVFHFRAFDFVQATHADLVALPAIVSGLLFFVVLDFLAYWVHRLKHTRWLWPTHAFHHSSRNLYWASGQRGSPVDLFSAALPALFVQIFFVPSGATLWIAMAYGVAHDSLIHSNLRLPSRLLNWIFVTGESHFVHHASDARMGNSNFGFLFTWWDRMFGTHLDPQTLPRDFPLGLAYEIGYAQLVIGISPPQPPSAPQLRDAA